MHVLNRSLGNVRKDESLALEVQRREKLGEVDYVTLAFHEAGRRRLRTKSAEGRDVGIDVGDAGALRDGDVLANADESVLMVVKVAPSEAMALRIAGEIAREDLFSYGVRLGHMLGNQHWPITVERDVVLAPLTIDRKVMETVVRTHGFDEIEWDFVPVEPGDVPTGMPEVGHHHA